MAGLNRNAASGVWRCMGRLCPELLFELSRRCLQASPSRALDGRIYCAVHGVTDANDLITARGIEARAKGNVLLLAPGLRGWLAAPRFTLDMDCAKSLLPSGLLTISRDPMVVCSTALAALAMKNAAMDVSRRWGRSVERR
jgi:hypothetical protein